MAISSNQIHVIHCFRSPVGGLFRHVCDQVKGQVKHGLNVGIICDSSTGGSQADSSLANLEQHCSLGIHRVPMSRGLSLTDIQVLRTLTKIYKEKKPDIIHSHGSKGGAYGRLLAKRFSAKSIYTPHGGSLHYSSKTPAGIIYLALERILKRLTDGLIFESQYSSDTYSRKIGSFPCPNRVIHNGLRETEFVSIGDVKPSNDFVFVGELRKLKGLDVLLQAVSQLRAQQKVSVLIFGAGPDADFFKDQIHKMGISDAITFLPPIFPSTKAFEQAHCIVIPSLAESFPYIVLEATAAKIPILTTNVGGIPEIFGPYAKHLIPPNNPDALASAMQRVIEEPQSAKQLAEVLQIHVKSRFGIETMVHETIEFYRQILNNNVAPY